MGSPISRLALGLLASCAAVPDAERARRAVRVGVDEMQALLCTHPERVRALGANAVECFLNTSYAPAPGDADVAARARSHAGANLLIVAAEWLETDARVYAGDTAQAAADYGHLLTFVNYAAQLLPRDDPRTAHLVRLANNACRAAGTLEAVLGLDPDAVLASDEASLDDLYSLVMWSINFLDAQTVPGLVLPAGAEDLTGKLWRYLARYRWPDARRLAAGANDERFYDIAYLATHVGYIPTGYGRHPLRVDDAPWLLAFLLTNFEPVLAMGELDLVAEFVDLLRQFGFDDSNAQVRTGTRHLLDLFDAAGGSWLAHREPDEEPEIELYDLLHKPWTAVSGVRTRVPSTGGVADYEAAFRRAMAGAARRDDTGTPPQGGGETGSR